MQLSVPRVTHARVASANILGERDRPGRQVSRSAQTNRVLVPSLRLSIADSRAFPVASPQIWYDVPDDVTSAQ